MATRRRADTGEDRITQLLREIRGDVHQAAAAELSGLSQSSVSRAEAGKRTLTPDEAKAYAAALKATPAQRRELIDLCKAAQAEAITGQTRLWRHADRIQERIRTLEQQATLIRSWQPEIVPGLLQVWDYTLAVIEREPTARWEAERRARVALLEQPGRLLHVVLSEAVLHWTVGSTDIMRNQLDHLAELSHRDNIRLGIVPFGPPALAPPQAFHLFGERAGEVDTMAGTYFVNPGADLTMLAEMFMRLEAAAVYDDAARSVMERAASMYR